jgi:two-component system phosphate regulon sensor histidine kinase PhoR
VIGQDARVALRHPDATALIGAADGTSVEIAGFTGGRSLWQLTRRALPDGSSAIELADRSGEAQIGRAHTDFVANASHELRTPLSTIIGYVETLGDDETIDRPTSARFLATVQREARRMLALVEDLMQLSQVEAEKHDRPTETLDLAGLVATAVAELNGAVGAGRLRFESTGACTVRGDARQLDQVVRNLSENALKYGDPDAPVELALACRESRAILTVRDHGPGIAPQHLPHLTRRFYRTDPGRSRAAGGTGLGLAIVKHIVERHGGTLDFASTLGEGTTVTVSLPSEPA